jgi:hypothetical protein
LIETIYRSTATLLDSLPGFEAAFLDLELQAFVAEACYMLDYEKSYKHVAFPDHKGWSGIKILRDNMHGKMIDAFKEDIEENNKISLYKYSLLSHGGPSNRFDWSQSIKVNPIQGVANTSEDDEVTVIKVITADEKRANNKSSSSSENENIMQELDRDCDGLKLSKRQKQQRLIISLKLKRKHRDTRP